MRKTEAQKTATQIVKVFAALGNLSPKDRYKAFELAAQSLDQSGSVAGVAYADTCGVLANQQWLQATQGNCGDCFQPLNICECPKGLQHP